MTGKTFTRAELSEAIADKAGLPRQKATQILETILEEMANGLQKEGRLKLSSFGSFAVRAKDTRVGRNPKTGQEVPIPPHKAVLFKASHIFKNRVLRGR